MRPVEVTWVLSLSQSNSFFSILLYVSYFFLYKWLYWPIETVSKLKCKENVQLLMYNCKMPMYLLSLF